MKICKKDTHTHTKNTPQLMFSVMELKKNKEIFFCADQRNKKKSKIQNLTPTFFLSGHYAKVLIYCYWKQNEMK